MSKEKKELSYGAISVLYQLLNLIELKNIEVVRGVNRIAEAIEDKQKFYGESLTKLKPTDIELKKKLDASKVELDISDANKKLFLEQLPEILKKGITGRDAAIYLEELEDFFKE